MLPSGRTGRLVGSGIGLGCSLGASLVFASEGPHPAVGRIENISAAIMHTAERIDIDIFIDVCKLFIN